MEELHPTPHPKPKAAEEAQAPADDPQQQLLDEMDYSVEHLLA